MALSRRDMVKAPLLAAGASMVGLAGTACAQARPAAQRETIALWPKPPAGRAHPGMTEIVEQSSSDPAHSSRRMKGISNPRLDVFPAADPNGGAMLIVPGGGFAWNYFEHEGHDVAEALNRAGITCFVLFYRLAQDGWAGPASVGPADAQRAMRVIRAEAARFHVDPARVGIMGFSAGGFLAASMATRHETPFYAPADATDTLSARPFLAAPIYPVQTLDPAYAYEGAAPSLFGRKAATEAEIRTWSPDLHVTAAAAPTFLTHAEDDGVVPVANSTRLRDTLLAQKIPVETHLFARGGHGFGIRPDAGGPGGLWLPLFLNFARGQRLLG
jgi:acetyl esterase/lipase